MQYPRRALNLMFVGLLARLLPCYMWIVGPLASHLSHAIWLSYKVYHFKVYNLKIFNYKM